MLLFVACFIGIIQIICGWIALRYRTDKLTDLAYGGTFFLVTWVIYIRGSAQTVLHTVLLILISCRSVRLALYLFLRVLALGKDKRFDGIREQKKSFTKFRVLQGVVIFLLLIPVVRTFGNSDASFVWYSFLGIVFAVGGIILESVADWQKFRFKQQYPTRWCSTGVWSKVQFPNYLGEMLVWIGIYLICLSSLSGIYAMVGLISPFAITRLLLFVTGIPPLYAAHKKQWGKEPERERYIEQTPKIIPYIY